MNITKEVKIVEKKLMTTIKTENCLCVEGGDLRKFKIDQLKTYLRHHGLRMVGAKFVLLSRIQEHQRYENLFFLSLNCMCCVDSLLRLLIPTAY